MRSKLAILFCFVLVIAMAIPASADEWNKKTTVTFNTPVEIPGMLLPAGTYVFKLLNSASNRNIVVVYNAEETRPITMILTIPNFRLRPVDEPVLRFKEGLNGGADAVHAWFFSTDQWGQEFVYPRKEAVLLEKRTGEPVLESAITPGETAEELIEAPVAVVTPENEEVYSEEVAEALAPGPPLEPLVALAAAEVAAEPAAAEELPKTASKIPLIALLGFSTAALAGLLNFTLKTH